MPSSPKLVRFVRRTLLSFAVFATLVGAVYVIENWRGERAWRAVAKHHADAGDPVDVLPAPASLPAEINFMKTPLVDRLLYARGTPELQTFLDHAAQPSSGSFEWRSGLRFDFAKYSARQQEERKRLKLPELSAATPVKAVLAAQAPIEPALAELRCAAHERPFSQLVRPQPISRNEPFNAQIPGFQIVRLLVHSLDASSCAMLAEGRADEAQASTLTALRFARGFTDMPDALLIEAMIGTVTTNATLQPIWEGTQQHAWTEPQLEQLQRELAEIKPLAALERAMHQERAGFVLTILSVPSEKLLDAMPNDKTRWQWRALAWGPRGWLKQNCVAGVNNMQAHFDLLAARRTPEFLTKMEGLKMAEQALGLAGFSPYTVATQMVLPAYIKVTTNTAATDSYIVLAQTVCALERHRIAHGSYPDQLAELIPTYIDKVPLDIIDGRPLRYRRTDDGKFVLYSIGLDGKDDGGKPVDPQKNDGPGDWAWPQPVDSK